MIFLILSAVDCYRSVHDLLNTRDWVLHSELVLRRMNEVSTNLFKVDSAVRGYAIKGQTMYLKTFEGDISLAQRSLTEVKALTVDRASLQDKLIQLEPLVQARINFVRQYIQVRQESGNIKASAIMKPEVALALRARISELLDKCKAQEQGVLTDRERRAATALSIANLTFWGSTACSILLLGGLYGLAMKHLKAQQGLGVDASRRAMLAEDERDKFFTLSLDMLCIASGDGYFKRVSPAFTRTLGWSVEELQTRPFLDFVHLDDQEATMAEVARQVAAGEDVLQFENRYLHKDGSWRILSWKSSPQPDGLMYATARDVTESKRVAQALDDRNVELQAAAQIKNQFLANMSHELRTPLNGIIGFSELLVDGKPGSLNPKQIEYLGDVLSSSRHLLQLINDILDLANIESGKMEFYPVCFSLTATVDEVCAVARPLILNKGLQVEVSIDPELGTVNLDPQKLKQVLYNLLSNAIKFTDRGGRISIVATPVLGGRFEVAVTDTGIGIKQEDLSRLFREFEQLETGTTRQYGGTGLGLALTKRIVEHQDGSIAVESIAGKGSTFTVNLPQSGP